MEELCRTAADLICIGTDAETCMAAECLPQEKLYLLERPIVNMDLLNTACAALDTTVEYQIEDVGKVEIEPKETEKEEEKEEVCRILYF